MLPLRIFIGYDEREAVAWHTLSHSIMRQSSRPVSVCPINIANLDGLYNRPYDVRQSNSFSFTRFLTPYLSGFKGWAVYMDCDMLLQADIATLFETYNDPQKAVYVVQHDYESKVESKYLGNLQYTYPRKNWSSFILWNCGHPSNSVVTAQFVDTAEPATLHRFAWLNDEEIGSLPVQWNWLVGEYENPPKDINNFHWTLGGPYFNQYSNVDYADIWNSEYNAMTFCLQNRVPRKRVG